jgi:tetratricopeptide (TPR) repeat protein
MDADNPVVKLCTEGMQAESEGRLAEAHDIFRQAWALRQDDFDACVAAHFLARHRPTPEEALHWNQVALAHAAAAANIPGAQVHGFFPSLYLNMGWSYEQIGDWAEAERYYARAAAQLDVLPAGSYGDVVRRGVAAGQKRVADAKQTEVTKIYP